MRTLILASLIFLFIAVGGVVGYLYFIAEPKRHADEPEASSEPNASKPVDKDQEVPLPDAGPSQPSQQQQKQKQEVPSRTNAQTEKEIPTPAAEDTPVPEPPADIVNPVLIHRVNPEYPEIARKSRVEGVVILEATVNKEGAVENLKVVRGLHPRVDQSAMKAVQQWRYKPATLNGKPVSVHFTISVKFKLK